jgi:ATP-dependent helicase/nuclease subunit B
LGLPHEHAPDSIRIPKYRARLQRLADSEAFYAKSFEVDPLGTARTLLAWRDSLVEAGWDGGHIPNGGERLAALTAIERLDADPLPRNVPDRLVRVQGALRDRIVQASIYDNIALVEERSLWSARWRNIFTALEQSGTHFECVSLVFPGAPQDTDLGRLQRLIRREPVSDVGIRGDGSLLLVRGETPDEVAELTAALLHAGQDGALVVRSSDPATLESALQRQGLPSQGHVGRSSWRPAMQLLPLALELAFEPRDPYRVLELLTLSVGPFRGLLGAMLARAVAKQPGVGGQEWNKRKARLTEVLRKREMSRLQALGKDGTDADAYVAARIQRIEDWLETPGAGPEGASREALIVLAQRVSTWLQKSLALGDTAVYGAAHTQSVAFAEALTHDVRDVLSREQARQVLDDLARAAQGHPLTVEQAGRVPYVAHPSAILAPARTLIFWGFVSDASQRPATQPWNRDELLSLDAAHINFPETGKLLACEADAWRRAALSASERVLFVVPNRAAAQPMSPHPMWDEIAARLGLNERSAQKLTLHAQRLVSEPSHLGPEVESLTPLALPSARAEWALPAGPFESSRQGKPTSATSLRTLASCPLSWVLDDAEVKSGITARVPEGPLLNGNLSHRLVEELFQIGAFDSEEEEFLSKADALLRQLVRMEAATLLLPGSAFERAQLEAQVRIGVRELHRYLAAAGFRIAGVEEALEIDSVIGRVSARLDLRLIDMQGNPAVLDLKWGATSYRKLIENGNAVQLAVYARALAPNLGAAEFFPPAAYFSLNSGKAISADARMRVAKPVAGASLEATWAGLERTLLAVKGTIEDGRILVGGTASALALIDALKIPEADRAKYFAVAKSDVCGYCPYSSICGKAWEELL